MNPPQDQLTLAGMSLSDIHQKHFKHVQTEAEAHNIIFQAPVSIEALFRKIPAFHEMWSRTLDCLHNQSTTEFPQVSDLRHIDVTALES